jgi:cytolysin-activating lysine-acyltransferase
MSRMPEAWVPPADSTTLGRIVRLMQGSPRHRAYSVGDVFREVWPCVARGQCLAGSWGFATWAFLTAEAEAGFVNRTRLLEPGDVAAGDRLWVLELVAPRGHAARAARAVRAHLEATTTATGARWTRTFGTGRVIRIGKAGRHASNHEAA